jgi:hypothetical protein
VLGGTRGSVERGLGDGGLDSCHHAINGQTAVLFVLIVAYNGTADLFTVGKAIAAWSDQPFAPSVEIKNTWSSIRAPI